MKQLGNFLSARSSPTIAIIAVSLFAFYEAAVKRVFLLFLSIDMYLAIRLTVTIIFLRWGLRCFGSHFTPHITIMSPTQIPGVFWARGVASLVSTLALTIALALSQSQAFAYAPFFLHPLWTISFDWCINKITGKSVTIVRREKKTLRVFFSRLWRTSLVLPMLLTISSITLYSISPKALPYLFNVSPLPIPTSPPRDCSILSRTHTHAKCEIQDRNRDTGTEADEQRNADADYYGSLTAAFISGLAFALANVFSGAAKNMLPDGLKNEPFIVSATGAFYTSIASLIVLAVAIPLATGINYLPKLNTICISMRWPTAFLSALCLLLASAIAAFATVLFAKAFVEEADRPVSATIDLGIAPIAFIIGIATFDINVNELTYTVRVVQIAFLALIIIGAAWLVRRDTQHKLQHLGVENKG